MEKKAQIRPLTTTCKTTKTQENLLLKYNDEPKEEEGKEKNEDNQLQITHHNYILKQFYSLVEIISKYCEPLKDALKEDSEKYNDFIKSVKECLQNGKLLLSKSLETMTNIISKSYGTLSSHDDISDVDHGLLIAKAMRTKEYNEALNELLQLDKKENNYENMESELLANNNYSIQIEMIPIENIVTNVVVYKNHDPYQLLADKEVAKTMIDTFSNSDKILEEYLTEIITFRNNFEKQAEMPPSSPSENINEEVVEIMKHAKQEQQHYNTKVKICIYYASHFAALRSCMGIDEKNYLNSLSSIVRWKTVSGGKAKATFCKTKNGSMILKFIKKKERDLFDRCGVQYFKHMCKAIAHQMPSILVRNLGMYKVKIGHSPASEISVMENLCNELSPTVVYDLKGSVKRRYV